MEGQVVGNSTVDQFKLPVDEKNEILVFKRMTWSFLF